MIFRRFSRVFGRSYAREYTEECYSAYRACVARAVNLRVRLATPDLVEYQKTEILREIAENNKLVAKLIKTCGMYKTMEDFCNDISTDLRLFELYLSFRDLSKRINHTDQEDSNEY